jgi:anti-sigma factor RsiW
MSDHLSAALLNALADGELSADELTGVNEHLAGCAACTSNALYQSMLKIATGKAGQRYTPPPDLHERLARRVLKERSQPAPSDLRDTRMSTSRQIGWLGWAAAAAVLLITASAVLVQRGMQRSAIVSSLQAGLITEISDQHIATLAANLPPQVLSSDRHTVKPWFQGKIPFSFNLPDNLPHDTTLDGANLTYVRSQPAAQLLYSIGKHRVSVFVREKGASSSRNLLAEHSGFHLAGFSTQDLDVIAVSDVDPARLSGLVGMIEQAQGVQKQPK